MTTYSIRVKIGDNNREVKFHFAFTNYASTSVQEQDKKFDEAVKELNRIYQNYGRFATEVGVSKLFEKYGFERFKP